MREDTRIVVATPSSMGASISGELNETAESGRAGGGDASSMGEEASGTGLEVSRGR